MVEGEAKVLQYAGVVAQQPLASSIISPRIHTTTARSRFMRKLSANQLFVVPILFRLFAEVPRGNEPISHLGRSAPPLVLSSFPGALSLVYLSALLSIAQPCSLAKHLTCFAARFPSRQSTCMHFHRSRSRLRPFPCVEFTLPVKVHVQEHQARLKALKLPSLLYSYLMRSIPAINKPKDDRARRISKTTQPRSSLLWCVDSRDCDELYLCVGIRMWAIQDTPISANWGLRECVLRGLSFPDPSHDRCLFGRSSVLIKNRQLRPVAQFLKHHLSPLTICRR
ncbi:hypothetical protein B0H65DRAFT_54501 [Neurospora tetraspora]|uniref:Uncharacterized protein n=1 Tax=Neurospora tetraspora TaxID=94610 RepID=A0AAE0JRI0_9PEZI|nr:hypothetical protein B0H65DRAFT_54501 [Neurospora tetraspora]